MPPGSAATSRYFSRTWWRSSSRSTKSRMSAIVLSHCVPANGSFLGNCHYDLAAVHVLLVTCAGQPFANSAKARLTIAIVQRQKPKSRGAARLVFEIVFRLPSILDRFRPHSSNAEARLLQERCHLVRVVTAGTVICRRQLEDVGAGRFKLFVPDGICRWHTFGAPSDGPHRAGRL